MIITAIQEIIRNFHTRVFILAYSEVKTATELTEPQSLLGETVIIDFFVFVTI